MAAGALLPVGTERLRSSAAIRAVFDAGRAAHTPAVVVHVLPRGDAASARVAVVAGRKVGGAVERNRAKRRLRAALGTLDLPPGTDIVVVARRRALDAPFEALCDDLRTGTDS